MEEQPTVLGKVEKVHAATYGELLEPPDYNAVMNSHVYIGAADQEICRQLQWFASGLDREALVFEPGCGPARLLLKAAGIPNIKLAGIDYDTSYTSYGRQVLDENGYGHIQIYNANLSQFLEVEQYRDYTGQADIVVSQGFHHHVAKGQAMVSYLANVYNLLRPGGYYILSDEFLPPYRDEAERRLRASIWYSHVIARGGHPRLPREEAKTLLDDLYEGEAETSFKTEEQIELTLASVTAINKAADAKNRREAEALANAYLTKLANLRVARQSGDRMLDLSRGDYKIDHAHFVKEVTPKFEIVSVATFGPVSRIGGMSVYTLRRPL